MQISNYLSNNQLSNKVLLRLIAICSLVGFVDTIYLTASHYLGAGVKCVLVEGCDIVLASEYAEIFGIPVALIGLIFYAVVFVLVSAADIYKNDLLPKLLLGAGALGFIASMIFLYIQIFVIEALCIYCLTSALSSTAIFITAILLNKNSKIGVHDRSSQDPPVQTGLVD